MLKTEDFIVPAFNDDVPHFAKPPLTYWAIAGGISLLGMNEWGVRLPNALAFAATILVVFALATTITPGRSWLPPLIYATFLFPYSAANIVTTDTLLTLWEAVAVLGFVQWWHCRERTGWFPSLLVMWGAFGLAFLTKGPPGMLPLLAIMVFVLLAGGWKKIPLLFSISGITTFALVGLGWYVMVAITHPGIIAYFIRDEFVNRIASGMHHRNPQWYKPFAIYIPVLMLGTLPWALPLLRAARSIPRTLFSRSWWQDKLDRDQWPVFLLLWVSLPLAVFFLSSSRLPLYILPLFAPLSLLVGRLTLVEYKRGIAAYLLVAWVFALVALKFSGSIYPYAKDSREMAKAIQAMVRPVPQEIVFIDSEPFWGLRLYLHSEVERVVTSNRDSTTTSSDEPLTAELLENEPSKLLIVDKRKAGLVITACRKLGMEVRTRGEYDTWLFLTPSQ
ncbi:MAG: glycosyltransferase family 39 protein [Syntrophaceae bacterium]